MKFLYVLAITVLLVAACAPQEQSDITYEDQFTLSGPANYITGFAASNGDGTINVVIEIPAGTNAKWEVTKDDGKMKWEFKDGNPRVVQFLPYPGNYGMIPQTMLAQEQGGDGDPLDVIVLGPAVERGAVVVAKPIGVLKMLDDGEQDDKILAVLEGSPLYSINDIDQLENQYPGVTTIVETWFTSYKGPGEIESLGFGDASEAQEIIEAAEQGRPVVQPSSSTPRTVEELEIKGSDTLLQLVSNAAETYADQTGTRISVTGGGSGTGIAALLNQEVDVADASRAMKETEWQQADDLGITVSEIIIGRDMLSVIVHPDNDVVELTKNEIGQIFAGQISNWKQLGGVDEDITLYGRQSTSGTYVFFRDEVVQDEYDDSMRNMEGNQAILEAVGQDTSGIGYVGLGYLTDDDGNSITSVSIVKVARSYTDEYVSPLEEDKRDMYPISRPLYQYVADLTKTSAIYDFLQFELSQAGQAIIEDTGFVGLTSVDQAHNDAQFARLE